MTPDSQALAASAAVPSKTAPSTLPEHSRALDVAAFERLYAQAHQEQAAVEFTGAADSRIRQSVAGVTKVIDTTSNLYVAAVDDSRAALSRLDPRDVKSVIAVMDSAVVAAVNGATLSMMLHEVSSAKKSVSELFHNQG